MENPTILSPREIVARGLVTEQKMEQLMEMLRKDVEWLRTEYPDSTFMMDNDDILRVEASPSDAWDIDCFLKDTRTAYTCFSLTIRE